MAIRRDVMLAIEQELPRPGWSVLVRDLRYAQRVLSGVRCHTGQRQRHYSLSADEAVIFIEERLEHLLQIVAPLPGAGADLPALATAGC